VTARATLGSVGKPFGLAGEVYVWLDADLQDVLTPGVRCVAAGRELEVAGVRWHKGRPVVRFAGVDDRDAVAELRGVELQVDRAAITADDVLWTDDVLGREVVDAAGSVVGVVEAVLDGAAHDFLQLARPDGGELLIPVVDELVDLDDPIVVHGPPGLVDPAEATD
jgi:16S rRNA processing protein RimM